MKTRKSKIIMIITISIPLFLCFIIICNLINDSVRIINSKETIYSTSQAFVESAYKTQTITLSLIGIAISVWIGLNLYNVLSKEELKVLLEQAEKAAEITQKVYTEVLMSKFRMSHTDSTANFFAKKLETIDILPDIILEKLIAIEDQYSFSYKLYAGHFSTIYNNQGITQCKNLMSICEDYRNNKIINNEQYSFIKGYLYIRLGDFSFFKTQYSVNIKEIDIAIQAYSIINNYKKALINLFGIFDFSLCTNPKYYDLYTQQCIAFIANSIGSAYLLFVPNLTDENLKDIISAENVAINFSAEMAPTIKAVFARNLGVAYEKYLEPDKAFQQYTESYKLDKKNVNTAHCIASFYLKQIRNLFPEINNDFHINDKFINVLLPQRKEILIRMIKHAIYWFKIKQYNNNGETDKILTKLYNCLYKLTNDEKFKYQYELLEEEIKIKRIVIR